MLEARFVLLGLGYLAQFREERRKSILEALNGDQAVDSLGSNHQKSEAIGFCQSALVHLV